MKRRIVRARMPESQPCFVEIRGEPYVSLLWAFGDEVNVPIDDVGTLVAGSRGTVMILRRLVGAERRMFEDYRRLEAECHARLIRREDLRFKRARQR